MNTAEFYKDALSKIVTELYQLRAIAGVLSVETHNGITTTKPVDPDDIDTIMGLSAALRDGTERMVKYLEEIDA